MWRTIIPVIILLISCEGTQVTGDCAIPGTRACNDTGDGYVRCVAASETEFLRIELPCGEHEVCEGYGECVCVNTCESYGDRRCEGPTVAQCVYDDQGCLYETEIADCSVTGQLCEERYDNFPMCVGSARIADWAPSQLPGNPQTP